MGKAVLMFMIDPLYALSGGADTSPVHAPASSQCMFCAPTFTRVPASAAFTCRTAVKLPNRLVICRSSMVDTAAVA